MPSHVLVLGGSSDPEAGVPMDLVVIPPSSADREPKAPIADADVYRAFPLFAYRNQAGIRLLAVGQARLLVSPGAVPALTVVVRALWRSSEGHAWTTAEDDPALGQTVQHWARGTSHTVPADVRGRAEVLAKGLSEASRDTLGDVQQLRYDLERRLAEQLDPGSVEALEPMLADAIQLSMAVGRAADEARAAVREGMWAWHSDKALYHARRHQFDPPLPVREGYEEALTSPWFATYDAGVRQCLSLQEGAEAALPLLDRLLSYGSTIANARDAQGQEAFNLVATVGTVALGVPALVLTLYGASSVLPLHLDSASARIAAPLIAGALAAVALALYLPGRYKRRDRFTYAGLAVALVIGLLLAAGFAFAKATTTGPSTPSPTPSASP